ncbi:hypothetical protein [Gracilibacillus phocaeensis]|uniref:hypothetical protein n=1 Tax=Gracilibacillus phocaeensis TaxID=2042304 RepID=UPI001A91B1CC|nr:hypothetical protein [Gracilibacillus phocaeensis]
MSKEKNIAKITFIHPPRQIQKKQNPLKDLMKEINHQQPDIIKRIVSNECEDKDIMKITVGGAENSTKEKIRAMDLFTEILKTSVTKNIKNSAVLSLTSLLSTIFHSLKKSV